jgi:hypothetical protein
MGTIPVMRVKGMSRLQYTFEWDKESRHYAYEPKTQREADDIFRTQGRLYKRMFFSVLMDEKKEPETDHHFVKEKTAPKKKKAKAEKIDPTPELQAVVEKDVAV